MDEQFFTDLETSISNIGSDELWKEEIGGRVVWLSPISYVANTKVNEALTSRDLGSNIINESKRITLSYAIVGIDKIDLRPYRESGAVFGPIKLPGGKMVKVDLSTYLYTKIAQWGQQFIDDCFSVFGDRLETHAKANLKSVKFENAKHPMDELAELMVRVTELRIQLGLPELTEKQEQEVDEAEEFERSVRAEAPNAEEDIVTPESEGFDPFKTVRTEHPPQIPVEPQRVPPPPPHLRQRSDYPESRPEPVVNTLPVSPPPQVARRAAEFADLEGHGSHTSSSNPFIATRSDDVVEPQVRPAAEPLVIDPVRQNKNPRFSPPRS